MRQRDMTKKIRALGIALLIVAGLLIAPLWIYISTFRTQVTANHQTWAEMGSAMSGIYTPILAILTLIVLVSQVRIQWDLNKHTFDQSYVQDARTDVQYYLALMEQEFLKKYVEGSQVGVTLIHQFARVGASELREPRLANLAKNLNEQNLRVMAIWLAYNSILAGLRMNDHQPYENTFVGAKQKAIVMLSYEGCAALDQFIWCVEQGQLPFELEFALDLKKQPVA